MKSKTRENRNMSSSDGGGTTAKKKHANDLSKLIPGYVAPMKLQVTTTGSNNCPSTRNISDLRKNAEKIENNPLSTLAMNMVARKIIATDPNKSFKFGDKKGKKKDPTCVGKGWFQMQSTEKTEEVKTDLAVLRMRHILDPKRFYKSTDATLGKGFLQVGTVIEGTGEYYSHRLTKKQRRNNVTEELMADPNVATYAKKKFIEIQHQKETKFYHLKRKSSTKK
jgi:hypothetical protein